MPTHILNLTDLETLIRRLEHAYGVATFDVMTNKSARARIPEDALLRWEAYVHHRARLRDLNQRTHSMYLSKLDTHPRSNKSLAVADELSFAA